MDENSIYLKKHLNCLHPTLKFTMEASDEKINFLDTTLHTDKEGQLWTEVYCKPTDSHSYLHYSSAHPLHCKRSLPYSQLLRLKPICSKRQDSMQNAHSLCVYFLHHKYPFKLILDALLKSSLKSRDDLIKISRKRMNDQLTVVKNEDSLFLTIICNPEYKGFEKMVLENWDLLKRSQATKELGL